ncbi:CYtochrome P450 family [Caenorhabditis elegans]|uniref:CYtochrome P450 family n=1 Tax=Caenorhabditis elegans TaxID=6239 RepID=G5EE22_CAEEL|nr:CYtochrome P450 family [Caenorhabditis elegans]CAA16294.2 CYtochrome P450 family [Caenorhabditis elegans]|eukprot:NP_507679.2 CYtochrome P450 family [Caenorhabditis elegans]
MLLLLIFSSIFLYFFYHFHWKRRNLPPGPRPLPFLGNLLSLKTLKPGYEAFSNWKKEYGPIFTFWMANKPFVIIASYEKMKETFVKDGDTYVDKQLTHTEKERLGENYGVLDTNGHMWKEHRRFTLTQLRDLGLGKDLMQEKILMEVEELFKELDAHGGEEIDLPKLIDRSVGNVINLTLFNKRFDMDKRDEFAHLKSLIDGMRNVTSQFRYLIQYLVPWTSTVLPGPTLSEKVRAKREELDDFFYSQIDEHRNEIDFDNTENLDFVEAYLKEQKKREEDGDFKTFCNKQLCAMLFDLWIAGLMTTTMTMTWGLSYYLYNPEVQRKIREELDKVIGNDRLISTADKNDLPYLQAFVTETQRTANIIPLNLIHMTTRDTVIDGFPIQKGTGVIAQISTVMYDEKVFPEPYKFKPERFIENGKFKKVDEVIPFSIGKRQCLGEGLARIELFLFFANIFNRYDVMPDFSGSLPDLDKSKDNFVIPRKFKAVLKRRYMD